MAKANFPTSIQIAPAKGIAGDRATLNPVIYTDKNYLAGDGKITIGCFVWRDDASMEDKVWKAKSTGAGKPLGFIERWHIYNNFEIRDGATMVISENYHDSHHCHDRN